MCCVCVCCFFFQAEDGIRDLVRSRGLGDVYKRQRLGAALAGRGSAGAGRAGAGVDSPSAGSPAAAAVGTAFRSGACAVGCAQLLLVLLSLIHI